MSSKKHVFVGMSGGVDSSVAAALLKDAGYDVTGGFVRVWEPPFLECDWQTEREDARRVASHLGIPFTTIDLQEEYKTRVVDYMIEEYRKGTTPNPDVMCNAYVKFGAMAHSAFDRGADYVATGHYASATHTEKGSYMYSGIDANKDQTYFLWKLTQKELSCTLFPIGRYHKNEVRDIARAFSLPVAQKKDSQGVCFLGKLDMKQFLQRFIETQCGDVIDEDGNVIGHHDGALLYTIGQRRGFSVENHTPDQDPFFVVDKDITKNTITVATKENVLKDHVVDQVFLEDINLMSHDKLEGEYLCRFRHRQPLRRCKVSQQGNKISVFFCESQDAVSVGQSLVLYDTTESDVDGNMVHRCVGGGIISSTHKAL